MIKQKLEASDQDLGGYNVEIDRVMTQSQRKMKINALEESQRG